ncbi:protein O-linked-mannose beta-1,2-N-acetylglucosaminyltransferase 1-like [Xenia sp. Carnegie-2017]|uniref:protein O-linked-mannose beta-1,2-N-acetylglucosaminyltransferase 1-like n=2 Tax=Xenia sp. Carnegie-2017 TaxID=2897299 RepID=UPI001F03CCAB|nr:protein O-linked-mannose beta-1,2-N-acetylglucosaminyltransferase 1-like [Xenia sp. Carnegie-2017]
MSWTPNPNAKPFHPTNAYYTFKIPCFSRAWKIRKKGMKGKCVQWLLVVILFITVFVNVLFIMDTISKYRKDKVSNHYTNDEPFEEKRRVIIDSKDHGNTIDVEVHSSKDSVYVSVEGTKVMEETTTNDAARGIHVTVLHQSTGAIMATRTFDTYMSKDESASLVLFLNMVSDGRILCFAIKDEATFNLKKTARNLLKSLGSVYADELKWRDSWSFIVTKRGQKYSEKHHHAADISNWGEPVTARATVPLVPAKQSQCAWDDSEESKRRRMFCDKFEGYGSVCSCNNPAPIEIKTTPLKLEKVQDIPVAVIASNRPHYLYRGLRSMLSAHGAKKELFTVFIDGFFEEPAAVARLYDVKVVQHIPISSKNARISQHYKRTLTETFNAYPNARYMIILEEDLDVSVDIFSYFNQLLPLMDTDESLYCISAWNDQGYDHTCNDPAMLYRIETMPGLGWLLKRRLYKEELEPKWPTPDLFWDWDMWMRMDSNKKGRECIIPDISRTYHFGAKGLNMNVFFQESYFKKHTLNTEPNVKFNVGLLKKENYEKEIERLVGLAEPLDHSKNPCKNEKDFVPETSDKTYIFYIEMKHANDWTTWNNIARCLRIWDLDARGFHKSMWRLWLKGNHVLIVGSPASPYAKHKPINVKPIFIPKKSETA